MESRERTIVVMALRSAAALVAAGATIVLAAGPAQASHVLLMRPDGAVRAHDDRYLPAPIGEELVPRARASVAAAPKRSQRATRAALQALLSTGAIDQPTYDRAIGDVNDAVDLTHRLSGARRQAIANVLSDLEGMAARGDVIAARLPALLATLEANIRWWTTGPLLGSGARIEFSGSDIVWQHYPGHGIQIQWLATFGKANALWRSGTASQFDAILSEAVALSGRRAGGIAFEYLFGFDGGSPPWVSGLAQGTALSALSRGTKRLKDPEWVGFAQSALGIFQAAPPTGVAQRTSAGTHYLQYSFAPSLHILNGFVQALNGLWDYATISGDPEGEALFSAGDAEARFELPHYDTGGWSRYSNYSESNLNYHKVLRDFLLGLCTRKEAAGDSGEPYCRYGYRFAKDLTSPPVVDIASPRRVARAKHATTTVFRIDKPATVTFAVHGAGGFSRSFSVSSGRHTVTWTPKRAGSYSIDIAATDLAGNSDRVSSATTVR